MLFEALCETAAAGVDVLAKLLHVALTGVAYPLQACLHGLKPRLTLR
jgi:hypothetical protein